MVSFYHLALKPRRTNIVARPLSTLTRNTCSLYDQQRLLHRFILRLTVCLFRFIHVTTLPGRRTRVRWTLIAQAEIGIPKLKKQMLFQRCNTHVLISSS